MAYSKRVQPFDQLRKRSLTCMCLISGRALRGRRIRNSAKGRCASARWCCLTMTATCWPRMPGRRPPALRPGKRSGRRSHAAPLALLQPAARYPIDEAQAAFTERVARYASRWQPAGLGAAYLDTTGLPGNLVEWCQDLASDVHAMGLAPSIGLTNGKFSASAAGQIGRAVPGADPRPRPCSRSFFPSRPQPCCPWSPTRSSNCGTWASAPWGSTPGCPPRPC